MTAAEQSEANLAGTPEARGDGQGSGSEGGNGNGDGDGKGSRPRIPYWLKVFRKALPPRPAPPKVRAADVAPPASMMDEWTEDAGRRDVVQRALARSAAHLSWTLERSWRAEATLLARQAERAAARRVERAEVLGRRLLGELPPARPRAGREDDAAAALPSVLLRRLKANAEGCRWLIDRWAELATLIGTGSPIGEPELLRLARLLGRDPLNAGYNEHVNTLLEACEAHNPGLGKRLFAAGLQRVPADDLALRSRRVWRPPSRGCTVPESEAVNAAEERQKLWVYLLELIVRETRRLKIRLERHLANDPVEPVEAAPGRALERLQRLQISLSRELRQVAEQLRKLRPAGEAPSKEPAVESHGRGDEAPPSVSAEHQPPCEDEAVGPAPDESPLRPPGPGEAASGPEAPATSNLHPLGNRTNACPCQTFVPPETEAAGPRHRGATTPSTLGCRAERGGVSSGDRPLADAAPGNSP